ncbi:metal-sensing transcriptional repressor [Rubrobacter tropicus]|uniref:Metal-sensing transcriptional repressor n=1 Tax=Rubrobacter tropicus TaxID=2653851 RepID=A0A6G8QFP6_9ACTN|nr:metal-sensing transcriptional repressor [Rubrobacter tropicus]
MGADDREKLKIRLRRIEGQVRGVQRMVEEDAPCADILTQIGAVAAASEKVALLVLQYHAGHRLHGAAGNDLGPDETVDELASAVERILPIRAKEGRGEGREGASRDT